MTDGTSPDLPLPRPEDPRKSEPAIVATTPPDSVRNVPPHAQPTQTGERATVEPGLTTDAAARLRVNLEAKGLSQEEIAAFEERGNFIVQKLGRGEQLTPEEQMEAMGLTEGLLGRAPESVAELQDVLRESIEEMRPPSEDMPDDPSELTGTQTEDTQPQELSQEEAERQAYERESQRLAREAYEKVQASTGDPLDVDKRKAAAEAIEKAKDHHDKEGKHGADNLQKTDPFWVKLVNGVAVGFYIYVFLQYMAASAAQNMAKQK